MRRYGTPSRAGLPIHSHALGADRASGCAAVDPGSQRFGQASGSFGIAGGALPDYQHPPAHLSKLVGCALVAIDIALQLGRPKCGVRRRCLGEPATLVRVPEASMDKDSNLPAWHGDVGRPRQIETMQPEAVSHREQRLANAKLRQGVLALDAGHHLAALGGANNIGHGRSRYATFTRATDQEALTSGMPSAGSE